MRRIWEKICVQSKSTVSGDVPGSSVSGLGADLGVPGTGEVSRDGAGAAYKSSSLSKRGILPCICIRKVLGDEFAASEGTAAERRAGIYSVRIGVKEDAVHKGGMNLFGNGFGDYPQDIVMKMWFS